MRIKKIVLNFGTGLLGMIVTQLLGFIVRTVFIYNLSEAYLGINGLFSSILNVLSIAELGVGGAITFALYKPLNDKDVEQIAALMQLYKKAYRVIGLVVLGIGLALIPALPVLIKERVEHINLYFMYVLYLLNSVASYLFFSYKSTLITADQKSYAVTFISLPVQLITSLSQIILLLTVKTKPNLIFYLYTVLGILGAVVRNLIVAKMVDKRYPYINKKNLVLIDSTTKAKIYKNIAALSMAKISRVALDSIDSIVISATLLGGISVIGRYSNYLMIVNSINAFFVQISNAMTSSLGNFLVKEDLAKSKYMFGCVDFLFKWVYGFCFISLWVLFNPFIGGVWISSEWVLSELAVFLISLNFLINGLMYAPIKYIQSAGLYWKAKSRYIISATTNLILSIAFVVIWGWGLEGILFATTLSLIGMTALDPYVVFKNIFGEKPWGYYFKTIVTLFAIIVTGYLVKMFCGIFLSDYSLRNFIIRLLICVLIPNAIWTVALFRTQGFKDTIGLLKQYKSVVANRKKAGRRPAN